MQTYQRKNDIRLFGVQAASFPDGVQQAWQDLHKRLPSTKGRNFYGISHGTANGKIVYTACVEEIYDGEGEAYGCKPFTLPQGEYMGEAIPDFMHQIEKIGAVFQALLARDDYDPNGVCVEQYLNETDVVCMLKRKGAVSL